MEKCWLEHYPAGVPHTVDFQNYASLTELFDKSCQRFANKPAFYDRGRVMTYAELQQRASGLAAFLQHDWACKKGDRIAIMLPNVLQYPILFFAALKVGAVVVNINPLYTVPELVTQLKDADVNTIVVLENFAHKVEAASNEWPLAHIMIAKLGDLLSPLASRAVNFIVKYIKRLVPAHGLLHAIDFKTALVTVPASFLKPVPVFPNDLALLQYTGGTTGTPKGTMLSHGNLIANTLQTRAWVGPSTVEGEEIVITALPLYHIFSLTANLLLFTVSGGMNVLIIDPRNTKDIIRTLRKVPFTVMTGVSTLYQALLNSPAFAQLNFKKFKWAISGGMPLQPEVANRFLALIGKPIIEGYGLTEASPIVAVAPLTTAQLAHSAGLPLPSTEIKIVNDAGGELGIGEIGELLVKGPQVMQGYWRQAEETQHVLANGWLKTGDIAKIDAQGLMFLVGRKKNLIIVSGFKVFPEEVEKIISMMPQVSDVVVLGDNQGTQQESVRAIIVKKDPSLTEAMVIEFCRQHLTNYKVPRKVEFRNLLPKTAVGKVSRKKLNAVDGSV